MSATNDSSELKMINDSLRALRDHFEKKGERFIIAWALFDNNPVNPKMQGNLISTTARDIDYLSATSGWTCMAVEHLSGGSTKFKL